MNASRSRRRISLAGALAFLVLVPATTLAYTGEVNANVVVTTDGGTVECKTAIPLEATVLGPSGTGNPDVTVTWEITDDELAILTSVTDADGVATNSITVDCIVGSRTVTAIAPGGAVGSITIVLTSEGLPNTSSAVNTSLASAFTSVGAVLLLGAGAVLLAGLASRRRRA